MNYILLGELTPKGEQLPQLIFFQLPRTVAVYISDILVGLVEDLFDKFGLPSQSAAHREAPLLLCARYAWLPFVAYYYYYILSEREMKVLIADVFGKATMDGLAKEGYEIAYDPSLEKDKLAAAIAKVQPTILVVRSTKVPKPMIDAMTSVWLIIRAGSGVDNIDIKAASAKGIQVSNCPGMNAVAVAELVMGLILSVDRRLPENVQLMKEGKWRKGDFVKQPGLYGRTLGCLGFGFVA